MDNHEALPEEENTSPQQQIHQPDGQDDGQQSDNDIYDYEREAPLDHATLSSNRRRSKYVFMTLCFLVALVFLYTYLTKANAGNTSDWFPLVGAIVLGILGIVFLRSSDNPPAHVPRAEEFTTHTANAEAAKRLSPFEELVQEALSTIPEEFHTQMENISVRVEPEPDAETRARVGLKEGYTLFGLYEGVPLTTYGRDAAPYPEIITIYQNPIEAYCRHNPTRIREQVRATVLHEIAHHFGMGHEEMPIWIK